MVQLSSVVLAVDGGQSSTLAIVAARDGRILGTGLAGPANHIHEPDGLERLGRALQQSIRLALQNAGCSPQQVSHICLGMTGAVQQAQDFAVQMFPTARVQAHPDMVAALAGASIARPGVVVIAGTGSVAYGRLEDGREARVGGWGYLFGDEGSAYSIGRAALQAASQAVDGRRSSTALSQDIPAFWGLATMHEVHDAVYTPKISRPQIAELAAVVSQTARKGDATAMDLLADAARALADMAYAVIVKLDTLQAGINVYTTGGVFRAGILVMDPFREALRARSILLHIEEAAFSPIVGALFLALQAAGINLDDGIVKAVRSGLPASAISKHQEIEAN